MELDYPKGNYYMPLNKQISQSHAWALKDAKLNFHVRTKIKFSYRNTKAISYFCTDMEILHHSMNKNLESSGFRYLKFMNNPITFVKKFLLQYLIYLKMLIKCCLRGYRVNYDEQDMVRFFVFLKIRMVKNGGFFTHRSCLLSYQKKKKIPGH